MKIYIIDDDEIHQQRTVSILYSLKKDIDLSLYSLHIYKTPEELIANAKSIEANDVFILDIDILENAKAGLEFAAILRRQHSRISIIFLTSYGSLAADAFSYRTFALDFIDKNLSDKELRNRMRSCFSYILSETNSADEETLFSFSNKYTHFKLPKNDIYYFETLPIKHKIKMVSKDRIVDFTSTLTEVESLDSNFIRCHKAYVVNAVNVYNIDKANKTVLLRNKYSCPISRTYYKKMLDLF